MDVQTERWMNGWTDGSADLKRMTGRKGGWTDEGQMGIQRQGRTDERTEGWTDGSKDGWTDKRME